MLHMSVGKFTALTCLDGLRNSLVPGIKGSENLGGITAYAEA